MKKLEDITIDDVFKLALFVVLLGVGLGALLCFVAARADAQEAHYRHDGPAVLNDLKFTPGATNNLSVKELCSKSFHTGSIRDVPESEKQAACREYGIDKAHCNGKKYELDHVISLELDGSNDLKNIMPEPYAPRPGAHEKDVVENWLHAQVCSGSIPLADAQREISQDWYRVYQKMQEKHGPH